MIQNVSDTAFLVAAHRAAESQRPDALFHDPLAARLSGAHGQRILEAMPGAMMTGWVVAMRTCIIDDYLQQAIAEGADAVLDLGAGLDARPYRMALPPALQWVEADYPSVVEFKDHRLAKETPACRLRRVGIDLTHRSTRQALFEEVAQSAARVVVLTEGVVPYLSVAEAATLADDLCAQPNFAHWIVDYFSPLTYRFNRRASVRRAMQNAPWRFQPPDYDAFFAAHGWRARETLLRDRRRETAPPAAAAAAAALVDRPDLAVRAGGEGRGAAARGGVRDVRASIKRVIPLFAVNTPCHRK